MTTVVPAILLGNAYWKNRGNNAPPTVTISLVGGGGGGGLGGGGGGGVIIVPGVSVIQGIQYPVVIGSGGTGVFPSNGLSLIHI